MKILVYLPDLDVKLLVRRTVIDELVINTNSSKDIDGRIKKLVFQGDADKLVLYMSSEIYCLNNKPNLVDANDYFIPEYLKLLLKDRLEHTNEYLDPYFEGENTLYNNIISYEII